MPEASIHEIFAEAEARGIGVFTGKERYAYEELSESEKKAIRTVFRVGLRQLAKVAPKIASDIEEQEPLIYGAAMIFKRITENTRPFQFPPTINSLGVAWLFPQAIKYAASPSPENPCYTSYETNSWNISMTAGTAAYLFGGSGETEWYRPSKTEGARAMILVFQDGVIEIGTTPATQQFHLIAEGLTGLTPYTVNPIKEIPLESGKTLYQYETQLGALISTPDLGIKWSFMPEVTKTSTIKLLGLVFYEPEFFKSLKWVTA